MSLDIPESVVNMEKTLNAALEQSLKQGVIPTRIEFKTSLNQELIKGSIWSTDKDAEPPRDAEMILSDLLGIHAVDCASFRDVMIDLKREYMEACKLKYGYQYDSSFKDDAFVCLVDEYRDLTGELLIAKNQKTKILLIRKLRELSERLRYKTSDIVREISGK